MNRLDQFLIVTARQMRIMPTALRDDELRELRGHLEQRVEDYAETGMSDDAAQLRALEGLGSPRKLGANLCDAWEGIAFGWWRLIAAIIGVTAFLLFGAAALLLATVVVIPRNAEIALLPEVVPTIYLLYALLPLACGTLFSHWLGRRGCIVAALTLGHLWILFPSSTIGFQGPPELLQEILNAPWFPYGWIALACVGAWAQQSWRLRKRHQLAIIGARALQPSRFLWVPLNLDWWRNAMLVTPVCVAFYAARAWVEFHPRTPAATLRNYLVLSRQMNFGEFEPPKLLATRELSAQSPAEIAGQEKRIWFRIEARMTPGYQVRHSKRIWHEKKLASSNPQLSSQTKGLETALNRNVRNREPIEGVARLLKTPDGWKVDEKNFPWWKMWAWATVTDPSAIHSEPSS